MRFNSALLALSFLASPALADHAGPSGVGGGSINVISPETLDAGQAAAGFRLSYTRPEQRPDSELAALAGEHVHAHNTDYNLNAALGLAYGVTHDLTLSVELPYIRRDHLREGSHSHVGGVAVNGVEQLGTIGGIGDASLLARYRLVHGAETAFSLIGGIKLPTGSTHERSEDGERLETEHQPGTGSWDPIAGAALGTEVGPLHLVASGLYQLSGTGAQRTRLGDRAQLGIAIGRRFGPPEHHHGQVDGDHSDGPDEHAGPHGHQSWDAFVEATWEWEGRQKVAGAVEEESGGNVLWISPAARFNSAGGLSLAAALGLPVAQHIRASHPDNRFRMTVSVGHAF